jgi:carbonic anhydrase/acetyltransferase-like protein (isoleucine patch superfamily)
MHKTSGFFSFSLICLFSLSAMPVTAYAATSSKCPGEDGYTFTNYRGHATRNPTNGGFVSNSAFVEDSAYIAPTAAVCNSASVLKSARVYGSAIIRDNARFYGIARVSGTAFVGGEAKVSDHAQVSGEAIVEGVTWVRGYTKVNSGLITEGTKKSVKPQSVINAEKRAAAAAAARAVAEKKQQQTRALKAEAKTKIKELARRLSHGDYYWKNFRRQTKRTYSWSVDRADGNSCKIVMDVRSVERGLRSGSIINDDDETLYYDIGGHWLSSKNTSYEGNSYCLETGRSSNTHEFCYSSVSNRDAVLALNNDIKRNYCKLF